MSRWDSAFFGLTSRSKEDLFLDDIEFLLQGYPGTSYWDWYKLPVPMRKFFINKCIKRAEKATGQTSDPKPMTLAEKMKINRDIAKVNNDPSKAINMMAPQRNRK